ncbi:pyridoxamine 5'-phosphate oxidase family protein [Campylobacter pinnipediorum]|uniref:Pyridoxamine 5'-phosphate oxidase putative domain-containing protein n=1 Tax=Campylobacter pinnipediorum subsp. pinnipediorum TaxID=1660067 RepID=A0AAX0L9R2_9BACT|nr:pyridoxamine 5'-phosphate oxidase family protein [Campylobacter pinnipediorum]AQW82955.1 putative protein pyridoxine 5'-phosphate oxidase family protein [Campylobacter pinnipediorum subsp. pinnipediorum]OPA77295.1 hypothetical protein BFG04_04160 [Campylobacter pinnipediorum subsp. pinnipediorum]
MIDKKIINFLNSQHLCSISVVLKDNTPHSFSAFYAFDEKTNTIIIASNDDTSHIKALNFQDIVSGTVAKNTLVVAKIQGIQFKGKMSFVSDKNEIYFKKFQYAKILNPKLWQIKLSWIKYTDNTLGFGKKIIWQDED